MGDNLPGVIKSDLLLANDRFVTAALVSTPTSLRASGTQTLNGIDHSTTSAMIVFKVFVAISVIALANCQDERPIPEGCDNGTRPIYVYNSAYTILPDGGFCCPEYHFQSNCISEEEVRRVCPHGIVYEPCAHCRTCAKGIGETCGGTHALQGICERATLECTVGTFPDENVTGVCVTLRKYRVQLYSSEYYTVAAIYMAMM